ncbi:hypothetical protein FB45DRAFT_1034899 [Roridomyces roridus]|uniref:F-box domain-containing protein n=1 Tax=Roridomyces roridus TaxID=1738132 RepID=A0AAD7BCC8_9AGAR|nr:hypothetical protein FB45DRAFT_1034899 [Roridomyces roridus]
MDSPAVLPFQAEEYIPEPTSTCRLFPPWDLDILNCLTFGTWKSLRVPKSRHTKDLSLFSAMHLDIILEVLSHLHPLDLLSVSSTSRTFRDLLLSPTGDTIWRNSFSDDGTDRLVPPPPPKSMSPGRWAALIYGHNICDECGASGTPPNYYLWRRVCTNCRHDLDLPWYARGHEIYGLIAQTGISHLTAEGQVILEQYEQLKAADDPKAFKEFIKSRKAVVGEIKAAAKKCVRWSSNLLDEFDHGRPSERVLKRGYFSKEGWAAVDIREVEWHITRIDHLRIIPQLSRAFWRRLRPFIIPNLVKARARRLKDERKPRIFERRNIIKAAALNVLSEPVPGSEYLFYPPPRTVCSLPKLTALAEELADAPLAIDDPRLVWALEDARGEVENWCIEQRTFLASLLPVNTGNTDDVDRVTSVFWIPSWDWPAPYSIAAGWSGARGFLHYFGSTLFRSAEEPQGVEYCERGAATALMLARLMGLSEHVTDAQMDALPARFVCGQCPLLGGGRLAMAWRECITHDVEDNQQDPTSHGTPSWILLSPLASLDVVRREPHESTVLPNWSCAMRSAGEPLNANWSSTPSISNVVDWDISSRCADEDRDTVELFAECAIWEHVANRHSIVMQSEDDWVEVPLFDRDM